MDPAELERRKFMYRITTVLVSFLAVCGILAALVLNGGFGAGQSEEEKLSQEEKPSQVREQCALLLQHEKYQEVIQLYESVSQYPQCQAEIKLQLKNHVIDAMMEEEAQRIPKAYHAFKGMPALFETVFDAINVGARKVYDDSYIDFMALHQQLGFEGFYLEELDAFVVGYIRQRLEENDYTFAATYVFLLDHCENCQEELQHLYADKLIGFLEAGDVYAAGDVHGQMQYVDIDDTYVIQVIKEQALSCLEQGRYSDAQYLLLILKNRGYPAYDYDARYGFYAASMYIYLEAGEYETAEKYVKRIPDDSVREPLLEALEAYMNNHG